MIIFNFQQILLIFYFYFTYGVYSIYTIVGVDAGIHVGYAVLNLSGKLVASGTLKGASSEKLIEVIFSFGIPLLIAADTSPPSHFVQKVSARLNVKLFHPQESMSKVEKKQIAKDIDDPHIRDSYSAAVKAYRKYQNRLRQIDSSSHSNKEELKKFVIIGERISDHI